VEKGKPGNKIKESKSTAFIYLFNFQKEKTISNLFILLNGFDNNTIGLYNS